MIRLYPVEPSNRFAVLRGKDFGVGVSVVIFNSQSALVLVRNLKDGVNALHLLVGKNTGRNRSESSNAGNRAHFKEVEVNIGVNSVGKSGAVGVNSIESVVQRKTHHTVYGVASAPLEASFDGVNSLKGYNAMVATGRYPDKPKIPRCLIVIDEYQFLLMNEKCVNVLENIARQGRSAGMSLVMTKIVRPLITMFILMTLILTRKLMSCL